MTDSNLAVSTKKQWQPGVLNNRRGHRKAVHFRANIVTATGIATALVTDMSRRGCRLSLITTLVPHQHLALEVQFESSPSTLDIALAQVQWTKGQTAGVEFVHLSQPTRLRLSELCRD